MDEPPSALALPLCWQPYVRTTAAGISFLFLMNTPKLAARVLRLSLNFFLDNFAHGIRKLFKETVASEL